MNKKLLGTYLNDHLAGADAAIELAKRCAAHNAHSPLGACLAGLVGQFKEDRGLLLEVMGAAGIRKRFASQTLASLAEKVRRLRPDGSLIMYTDLSRLLDLESLRIGIEGKRCLWSTLQQLEVDGVGMDGIDFGQLLQRASDQQLALEPHRLEAAEKALVGAAAPERPTHGEGGEVSQHSHMAR